MGRMRLGAVATVIIINLVGLNYALSLQLPQYSMLLSTYDDERLIPPKQPPKKCVLDSNNKDNSIIWNEISKENDDIDTQISHFFDNVDNITERNNNDYPKCVNEVKIYRKIIKTGKIVSDINEKIEIGLYEIIVEHNGIKYSLIPKRRSTFHRLIRE